MQVIYNKLLEIAEESYNKCSKNENSNCTNCPLARIILSRSGDSQEYSICDMLDRI